MADLEQWLPAVPEGEQLLAAAPMFCEWRGPNMVGWRAGAPPALAGLGYPIMAAFGDPFSKWWIWVIYLVAVFAVSRLFWLWWQKGHPRPTGMAAALDWKGGRGPVLLVTGSGVLQTGLRNGTTGRTRPSGPAKDIPGLVALDAVDERLVLSFEDGSEAWLRQRWSTPGAAARVAAVATPVLHPRPARRQTASAH